MTLLDKHRAAKQKLKEIADRGGLYLHESGSQCATREYNEALKEVRDIETELDNSGIEYSDHEYEN